MSTSTGAQPGGIAVPAPVTAPIVLPPRYDGEPITHLSHSSLQLFQMCPEAYRRRYIKGEKAPASPGMFLGTAVDVALSKAAEARIRGEHPEPGDILRFYDEGFEPALAEQKLGVAWTTEESLDAIRAEGRQAVELVVSRMLPLLGRPLASQRKSEIRLSPLHQWTIQGYIDLETERREIVAIQPDNGRVLEILAVDGHVCGDEEAARAGGAAIHERTLQGVVDYKVKGKLLSQTDADKAPQATLYIAMRDIHGTPADDFTFAVARRANKSGQLDCKPVRTIRSSQAKRAILARFAVMASGIVAMYERLGPDRAWPLANPEHWKCSPRFCEAWKTCPGGGA